MTSKKSKAPRKPKAPPATATAPVSAPGPGRPPGSPNKKYADVKVIPPVCPAPDCNSTDFNAIRGAAPIVRDLAGVDAQGFHYSQVKWQRSVCKKCGQLVTLRTYFPAKENA